MKLVATLIACLTLTAALITAQPQSDTTASVKPIFQTQSSSEQTPASLRKQTEIIRPKTVTNWSKVKDLFQ